MLWWQLPEVWISLALSCTLGGLVVGGFAIRTRRQLEAQLADTEFKHQHAQFEVSRQSPELQRLEEQNERLLLQLRQRETRLAGLESRQQAEQKHHREQVALLTDTRDALKAEFSQLANEIFEAKGKRFSEQSQTSLNALLTPFREQVQEFRKRIDDIHTQDTRGQSELMTQLTQLKDLNTQLNQQADDLTRALKGDKKLQGNWGEIQAEKILESAGLQRGREYDREASFKDDYGQNKRPDFLVNLPDGKHLIVDSKVSLNDYQQYVAAETELERELALKRHVAAVRQHIRSLSDKNYPHLNGLNSPDFVLMFMPIEPAFIAAFQSDPALFNDGFKQNIVVVTPTTLLATLRTVSNLWTLERQNVNAKQLFDQAGKVYDKLRTFAIHMEKLGSQINTASNTYDSAWKTLRDGRGSLVRQVEILEELGATVRQKLPDSVATELSANHSANGSGPASNGPDPTSTEDH
jgi:DNA recombination protein RmuC